MNSTKIIVIALLALCIMAFVPMVSADASVTPVNSNVSVSNVSVSVSNVSVNVTSAPVVMTADGYVNKYHAIDIVSDLKNSYEYQILNSGYWSRYCKLHVPS